MTMWEKPDAPPTKTTGACVNKMILGGRYCESRYTATMMGMAFEGIGVLAYDNQRKVFINSWIDNMGTGITVMEGTWDDATHSLELKGKVTNPLTGKDCNLRQVTKWTDKDHQTMEMYRTVDGKEMKDMEIVMTRK